MPDRIVTIINKLGLHARAAARFVQVASEFESDINVIHGEKEVNGKSIMGVMMLAAGKGSEIRIVASGGDETQALNKLGELVENRFGESE
ncbi:MAG: HPr family phosphocarrier protein [Gammaproteobacteria bacterium]|nr:HPr family phosphocarrier protein [Gammaproteobacteria bacterium]NIN62481.1 HPr family phosphocarrier protein [Gammaproteobacteria bacterium]NIO62864.1 HPr family phosphocarrier protein [Gammaproteobacteria bacterium]NIP49956.1 HPr family phosphocarrier protein [Gammaproteobacteria bacterium]NIQ12175.1 HPr family phosphocarrier protein [Gammaproteobacteria bacterium]